MNPEALSAAVLAVLDPIAASLRPDEELGVDAADIVLERPRNRDHGDWSTNIAMRVAKRLGSNPRELAQRIADGLAETDGIAGVEIAGPGFINIRLDAGAAGALAKTIVDQGASFGCNDSRADEVINLEFVSANPTGPIHLGGTRWAAVGDALARILASQGARSRGSTTSTTTARRSTVSHAVSSRRTRGSRRPRTVTAAPTSPT